MIHFLMGRLPAKTGGERYNLRCIEALEQQGHRVKYHWVSPYRSGSLIGLIPGIGGLLSSPFVALFFAWRRGVFVVDQHFLEPLLVTNLLRRSFGLGPLNVIVHHIDNYDSDDASLLSRIYHKLLLSASDRVIAVSEYTREEVLSLGYSDSQTVVVPPGFTAGEKRGTRPASRPLKCLALGRCERRKDWATLLRAVACLSPDEVQLTLVGSTESTYFKDIVEPLYRELKLQDRIRFLGPRDRAELDQIFVEHDVLVHPSLQEGFGIVILEAFQRGLAVVSSDSSALPELVQDGTTGLLFSTGDYKELANSLRRLLDDPELPEILREKASEKARQYSWERTQSEFVAAIKLEL